jgi:hypothetical protein
MHIKDQIAEACRRFCSRQTIAQGHMQESVYVALLMSSKKEQSDGIQVIFST